MTSRLPSPLRPLIAAAALILASLLTAAPAAAFDGDWTLTGSFARSTTPSFVGGFNPDDIDRVEATYDNRTKQLRLTLATFDAPSGDPVRVAFGMGRVDGTCALGAAELMITSQAAAQERTVSETVWEWSPPQERRTWSNTWPGTGWAYAGYDTWSRMYRWIKPGSWVPRTVQRTIIESDPTRLDRTAVLTRAGVDGTLITTTTVDAGGRDATWTFAAPQLDGLMADCLAITVPNRAAPFELAPPQPVTAPNPQPGDPVGPNDPDAIDLDQIDITATRRGTAIEVLLIGGETEHIGIRVRRASRTIPFRHRLLLRRQPTTVRAILIRLSDGTDWSAWETVPVR
ncbi:MAG: hypothetical protein ACR2J9_00760 [Gaiellales bacterium]